MAAILAITLCACQVKKAGGPDPIFEKPSPITMAEMEARTFKGVCAVEVNDYVYPGYEGDFKSPPHADLNPKKAIIISWGDKTHQLVFAHEASYTPLLMVPSGAGLCNQFFESHKADTELFSYPGRQERNSFVDIIESGPDRAWVRWTYLCVHPTDGEPPVLRGTEDYVAYPNGLIWRRLTYDSLKSDHHEGYSNQPIDNFFSIPAKVEWPTLIRKDKEHGDYHVAAVLDAASDRRYDIFWAEPEPGVVRGHGYGIDKARRNGDNETLQQIARSPLGFAVVTPFKGEMPFIIFGNASGFDASKSQLVDHSHNDTGGWGWGAVEWDHWPVGRINWTDAVRAVGSPYPYHMGPMSHYVVDTPIKKPGDCKDLTKPGDFMDRLKDMEMNHWLGQHVFYTLRGVGTDFEEIHELSKKWLKKGKACATPESVANLKP